MKSAQIRGNVLSGRLKYLRDLGGDALVREVLDKMPAPDRDTLTRIVLPIAWFPLDLELRLDDAIADVLCPTDRARALIDLGRASADESLRGPQKVFVKDGDPHYLLSHAPQIYRMYYAVGHRTYEKTGPRSAVLRTFEGEEVTANDCLTVVGWHQRAIELCGVLSAKVEHPICRARGGAHCEYVCSWE